MRQSSVHKIAPGQSHALKALPIGGKASGLAALLDKGANVPAAFVIARAEGNLNEAAIARAYHDLGAGAVAVRSSALAEDGDEASFAGQFESFLNVHGEEAVLQAVRDCVAAAAGARVSAYREDQSTPPDDGMAVVVQRMVPARWAGVAFTADPVSHRRDRCIVDVVAGLGEGLVSGAVQSDHFVFDAAGEPLVAEAAPQPSGVPNDVVRAIAMEAANIAERFAQPLDLEWAWDQDGTLWWLQARPITTLGADPNDLDILPERPDDVLTRQNIGEIIPGAVTPLTISTTGRGIDYGTQAMIVACGAQADIDERPQAVAAIGSHLFINLSTLAKVAGAVLGSHTDQIGISVCGRIVPELKPVAAKPMPVRLWNAIKYFRYMTGAKRRIAQFGPRVDAFAIETSADPITTYHAICEALPFLNETYAVHMQSSAGSGALTGTLHQIFAKGGAPSTEDYTRIAQLFSSLGNVEGMALIDDLQSVADAIAGSPDHQVCFIEASPENAMGWLLDKASGPVHQVFMAFLDRHGHRAFRELEMAEKGWRDDPMPLVASLRTSVKAGPAGTQTSQGERPIQEESWAIRQLIKRAGQAVQRREQTKELLVRVTNTFKQAYRTLGHGLADRGMLQSPDDVFFLTHEELGHVIAGTMPGAWKTTTDRKRIHPVQERYVFPEVFTGCPDPVPPKVSGDDRITGNPVCVGVVEGRARVAHTPEEADGLEAGDILIAPVTDIGWTPYFRLIAGLATDVGSSVSHGAVIAREYGMPALVNTGNGTSAIRTGDRIRLDAYAGTIEILSRV